jgi:L-ascorbate metabolism protein UlaG (beta-lactamase superfamily)
LHGEPWSLPRPRGPPESSRLSLPDAEPRSALRTEDGAFAERKKELDFEQRDWLRGPVRAALSLGILRHVWRRLWTPTVPARPQSVPAPARGSLAITFGGHATVMMTTAGVRLVTDPLFESWLHGMRRARASALDRRDLEQVDLVLISNARRDHLSLTSLGALPRAATLVVPVGCGALVEKLKFARVVELGVGRGFAFGDVEINAVPAQNGTHAGVTANGYLVRTKARSAYFAGDTGYFPGFADIGRRFSPDVALLPIAGYQPAPWRRAHLSPLDALYALEDLGARFLVPVGYGSFPLSYEPLEEPLAWLRTLAKQRDVADSLIVLEHGQTCLLR